MPSDDALLDALRKQTRQMQDLTQSILLLTQAIAMMVDPDDEPMGGPAFLSEPRAD